MTLEVPALKPVGSFVGPFMGLFPLSLTPNRTVLSSTEPELSCEPYRNGLLAQFLLDWLGLILIPSNLHRVLRATTTSASRTFTQPDWHDGCRGIYTSAGTDILKLNMSRSAMVLISFLYCIAAHMPAVPGHLRFQSTYVDRISRQLCNAETWRCNSRRASIYLGLGSEAHGGPR